MCWEAGDGPGQALERSRPKQGDTWFGGEELPYEVRDTGSVSGQPQTHEALQPWVVALGYSGPEPEGLPPPLASSLAEQHHQTRGICRAPTAVCSWELWVPFSVATSFLRQPQP